MRASSGTGTSLRASARQPIGTVPPIHMPRALEAAILSRMRSAVTSRSNWANDSSMFSISRPIEVVVLNASVIDTKDTPAASERVDVRMHGVEVRLRPNGIAGLVREVVAGNRRAA